MNTLGIFKNIWLKPKKTYHQVTSGNFPWQYQWLLFAVVGIAKSFSTGELYKLQPPYTSSKLIIRFLLGGFSGILIMSVLTIIVYYTVKLIFKGKATYENTRTVIALSCIPYIIVLLTAIVMKFSHDDEVATSIKTTLTDLITIGLKIWGFYIGVETLSAAHKINRLKAAISFILIPLLIIVPLVMVFFFDTSII